jgi:hypothetical protein
VRVCAEATAAQACWCLHSAQGVVKLCMEWQHAVLASVGARWRMPSPLHIRSTVRSWGSGILCRINGPTGSINPIRSDVGTLKTIKLLWGALLDLCWYLGMPGKWLWKVRACTLALSPLPELTRCGQLVGSVRSLWRHVHMGLEATPHNGWDSKQHLTMDAIISVRRVRAQSSQACACEHVRIARCRAT